jgi:anti-anti-sigma factor
MRALMTEPTNDLFRIERQGEVVVIVPSSEVENMAESLILPAAQMVLAPFKNDPPAGLIVDLTGIQFFGSVFVSFLLKCHLLAKKSGGELVLAGVVPRIRELLRITSLDTLWALYETRAEALAAFESD